MAERTMRFAQLFQVFHQAHAGQFPRVCSRHRAPCRLRQRDQPWWAACSVRETVSSTGILPEPSRTRASAPESESMPPSTTAVGLVSSTTCATWMAGRAAGTCSPVEGGWMLG